MPHRQEVVNVILAQLLQERGLVASPEMVVTRPGETMCLPDVVVDFQGLRLIIEAEYSTAQGADKKASSKAQERIDSGLAHIGVAVVYPAAVRTATFARLSQVLTTARLRFSIASELTAKETQLYLFGEPDYQVVFISGTIDDLAEALRRAHGELARDDTVTRAVNLIESNIEGVLLSMSLQPATPLRIAREIGMWEIPHDDGQEDSAHTLTPRQQIALSRIAALIAENAMIFQEVLSQHDSRVDPLGRARDAESNSKFLRDHWRYILDEINYFPIFDIAYRILGCFSADEGTERALAALMDTACKIVSCRAALRHDLAGRIYHRLLEEAKYLGAYYTTIPSASLLLKLALRPDRFSCDWSSIQELQGFHVADLACGTGTLLMASADVIADNYIRTSLIQHTTPDPQALQQTLVANSIYGYDVVASAVHLTASTLSLRVPEVPINTTHLYQMLLGGPEDTLGTLEFLDNTNAVATLFGAPQQVTGGGVTDGTPLIPRLDLCVMNPPFTRSVGGNLLFGNFPEADRARMQKRLRQIVGRQNISASITAGLGSVFVALADKKVKPSGTLALVLPRALLSGVSWGKTRHLIEATYYVEYIIVSHEPNRWNFSENTSLSETLVIARKRRVQQDSQVTRYVNLWRQPRSSVEALAIASAIMQGTAPTLVDPGTMEIKIGDEKVGELNTVPWSEVSGNLWSLPCSFAQAELNRTVLQLRRSVLYVPRQGATKTIPTVPLGTIADLGFDRRDMHDGFTLSQSRTAYPAFWQHDARRVTSLCQEPNQWLQARSRAAAGRPLRDADALWGKASRLLIVERFRVNTMRLPSVYLSEPVLSNVWWTIIIKDALASSDNEKIMALWLNSTLGLMLFLGHREETEGPWVDFKKPNLEAMPVLDISKLPARKRRSLVEVFDRWSAQTVQPLAALAEDTARKAIDDAFCGVLNIPDVKPIRDLLALEPLVRLSMDGIEP